MIISSALTMAFSIAHNYAIIFSDLGLYYQINFSAHIRTISLALTPPNTISLNSGPNLGKPSNAHTMAQYSAQKLSNYLSKTNSSWVPTFRLYLPLTLETS